MAKRQDVDAILGKLYNAYCEKAAEDAAKKGKSVGKGFHSPYTRIKGISFVEAVELLTGLTREKAQALISERFHLLPARGGRWIVSGDDYKVPKKNEKRDKRAELLALLGD